VSKVGVAHASAASQGRVIASALSLNEKPDSKAIYWSGVGLAGLLALFAMSASGLLNFIAWSFTTSASATAGKVHSALQQSAQKADTVFHRVEGAFLTRDPLGNQVLKQVQALS
jgi:hypothetical protein